MCEMWQTRAKEAKGQAAKPKCDSRSGERCLPQLKTQYLQRDGNKIHFSGSDDCWEKTVTFEVLCKMIDTKKTTWRLPFIAYVIRGNVILLVC